MLYRTYTRIIVEQYCATNCTDHIVQNMLYRKYCAKMLSVSFRMESVVQQNLVQNILYRKCYTGGWYTGDVILDNIAIVFWGIGFWALYLGTYRR